MQLCLKRVNVEVLDPLCFPMPRPCSNLHLVVRPGHLHHVSHDVAAGILPMTSAQQCVHGLLHAHLAIGQPELTILMRNLLTDLKCAAQGLTRGRYVDIDVVLLASVTALNMMTLASVAYPKLLSGQRSTNVRKLIVERFRHTYYKNYHSRHRCQTPSRPLG